MNNISLRDNDFDHFLDTCEATRNPNKAIVDAIELLDSVECPTENRMMWDSERMLSNKEWKDGGTFKDKQWCPYHDTYVGVFTEFLDGVAVLHCNKCKLPLRSK